MPDVIGSIIGAIIVISLLVPLPIIIYKIFKQ
jgi:hypothetical protein